MGLVIPQKVRVSWNGTNKQHFVSKGYKFTKLFTEFEVDVLDLSEGSSFMVQVQCDYCADIYPYSYRKYLRTINDGSVGKISCKRKECRKLYKEDSIRSSGQRFSLEQVRKIFAEQQCEFLDDEYKGYKHQHRFRCRCGKTDYISMDTFRNKKQWCKDCSRIVMGRKDRLDLKYVQSIYKSKDCKLLEQEYINNSTPMWYLCSCGNEGYKSLQAFQLSSLCEKCVKDSYKKRGESRRYTQAEVEKIFRDGNCKLTGVYESFHKPVAYICQCGRPSKISLNKFLFGRRCKKCFTDRNKGENNRSYNPNKTDEERQFGRILEGYKDWKRQVKQRDDYTCQCCNQRGGRELHSHHIFSYSRFPELRVALENGITLCVRCHKEEGGYHHIYGNKNDTPDNLVSFLRSKGAFQTADRIEQFIQEVKSKA